VAGVALVALGFYVGMSLFSKKSKLPTTTSNFSFIAIRRQLGFFLAIGVPIKYLLSLPYHFGLLNWVLPGSIEILSVFTGSAIILLFVLVHNGQPQYRLALYMLIGTEVIVSLMTFSKLAVIKTALTVLLGMYLSRPRSRTFIIGVGALMLGYVFFLAPFISYSRVGDNIYGVTSLGKLTTSLQEYQNTGPSGSSVADQGFESQGWWTRLNYAGAQSFAMDAYDNGRGGDSFSLAFYTLTPRFIFPDKPVMTIGPYFNNLVTGNSGSASAPGLFAEAYWNGGWLYVVISCLYVGSIFAMLTVLSSFYITTRRLIFLPCIFISITTGLTPDSWFVATVVGGVVQCAALYFVLLYLVEPLTEPKRSLRKMKATLAPG
jgi:hypothetical protein